MKTRDVPKSFYIEKSLFPVSWGVDYSLCSAIIKLANQSTGFDDVRMVNYKMFYHDQDLAEATLNISLMELIRESFNDDDNYLDWLDYYTKSGDLESDYI